MFIKHLENCKAFECKRDSYYFCSTETYHSNCFVVGKRNFLFRNSLEVLILILDIMSDNIDFVSEIFRLEKQHFHETIETILLISIDSLRERNSDVYRLEFEM